MNIRMALIGTALVAGTALLASPASARAIRTDASSFAPSCSPNTSTLSFNPGLTGTPDVCFQSGPLDDQGDGFGPYESDATTVYSWDSGDATDNWNNSVQVVFYSLDGNFGDGSSTIPVASGDTEIAFNYVNGEGTCLVNPSALSSTPTLTFGGKTYQFTGAGGAGICDATSTSDFVFSPTGYIGWIDDSSTLETSGYPPGWTVASTSVPEPDSFALALIGGALAAGFALWRHRPRSG